MTQIAYMCPFNTELNSCGYKPGHDGRSQLSLCVVSAQEGLPSVSWQRRVLVIWPCPQEAEQELHGLQGS